MRFFLKRLVSMIPVLFVVTFLSFLLLNALPGDPVLNILGPQAAGDPVKLAAEHKRLGLDQPMVERYGKFVAHAATGDLGRSIQNNQTVADGIKQRLPITLELLVLSQLLAILVAIPLGIFGAYRPDGIIDRIGSTTTFGLLAAPSFVVAIPLIFIFAVTLKWLPAIWVSQTDEFIRLTPHFEVIWSHWAQNLKSMALPVITLALPEMAAYQRLLRADMIATLQEDYIIMARAKGLPTWYILLRHALRPSTFSVITIAGLNIGRLLGGTILVEIIFSMPGIGAYIVTAIFIKDFPVVQGTVLFIAVAYVLINFAVDAFYSIVDPRVRHA